MGKNKLKKFLEIEKFPRVYQPEIEEIYQKDYVLKGNWSSEVFKNSNPIILELGCGKGEYTVAMAEMFPDKNFVGIDIKGARMWQGAKTSNEKNLENTAFLRTRIEFVESLFAQDEVDEIWITFPDPQLKNRRRKKRLSSPNFLNIYRSFLKDQGVINLKTDNEFLFDYTKEIAHTNRLTILKETKDLYQSDFIDEKLAIRTYYEKLFLKEGSKINYIAFCLPQKTKITENLNDYE